MDRGIPVVYDGDPLGHPVPKELGTGYGQRDTSCLYMGIVGIP